MSPELEKWLRAAIRSACDGVSEGKPLLSISESQRRIAAKVPCASRGDRASLVAAAMSYARAGKADPSNLGRRSSVEILERAANAVDRRIQGKAKAVIVSSALDRGRSKPGEPAIFFLCSWHQTPAEGHKDLQGKVYVDRMWRSALRSRGMDAMIPEIEAAIRERGIMTVQDSMKSPHYLVVRPYCRHRFYPISIHEAIGMTEDEARAAHPEARDYRHRSKTDAKRYREKKARIEYARSRAEEAMAAKG